ncbi:hypothetical protein ACFSFW_05050 [Fredinandcohnia salidurans]|uniref:Uncharacterized protein n=1 Tax=Fredinandcohnia salidurans TaxID=2595041 RepID=A0ABW4MKB0_9BACI
MVTPDCSIAYYNQLVERFGQNQIEGRSSKSAGHLGHTRQGSGHS